MGQTLDRIHQFGSLTLDEGRGTLTLAERQLRLRPKAFALLVHLARNAGRVVPKSELMESVWPQIYVTEDSLTQSIREIRRTLGPDLQDLVRTVSGRGYMLIGAIEPDPNPTGQPVIAVLRFRAVGGDGSHKSLVDAFVEDIVSSLSLTGSLTVIARSSSFQFTSGSDAEALRAAQELGATYLVEGAIRWSQQPALISVSLSDAVRQHQIWGERYETADAGIFAALSDIADQIVARLVMRVEQEGTRRSASRPATSLSVYELLTRGIALLRSSDPDVILKAKASLDGAIALDPTYSLAHAWVGQAKIMAAGFGAARRETLLDALTSTSTAINLAPMQAVGWRVRSLIRLFLRQHEAAEDDLRRAFRLNPCDPETLEQMGYLLTMRGRPLEALDWIGRAVRLNPILSQWYHFDRALALYALGEYRAAADALELSPPLQPWVDQRLAVCYARLGDQSRTLEHLGAMLAFDTGLTSTEKALDGIPFEHRADRDHLAEGIELAFRLAADCQK